MQNILSSQLHLTLGNSQLHLKLSNSPFVPRLLVYALNILELNKILAMDDTSHHPLAKKPPHAGAAMTLSKQLPCWGEEKAPQHQ